MTERLRRRLSAGASAAILAAIALIRLPITGPSLLERTADLHTRLNPGRQMLHVYSGVQGRPTETCDTFLPRQDATLRAIAADAARDTVRESAFSQIPAAIRVFDRRMRELFFHRPDESCWKEFNDYAYYQAGFPTDAPFIWTFRRLGLSTIHVTLALMLGSWAGIVCLFLIARRLTGSDLVGLGSVLANIAVWHVWDIQTGAYLFILNSFVPIYLGMLLGSSGGIGAWRGIASVALDAALVAVFAVHSFLQVFIYPFTHRVNGLLVIFVVLAIGALRRDRRIVLRGVALLVAVNLVTAPFNRELGGVYRQLTNQNLAANEGFAPAQMAFGLYERPTYLGLPNGDYGFTWMHAIDPYLYYTAPNLIVHQSFKHFGTTILGEVLLTSPLTLIEAVVKRLFIQIAYHHHLFFWWYDPFDGAARLRYAVLAVAFVLFVAGCIWSLNRPHRWAMWWPGAALILWHGLGVNTLLTVVHAHDDYVVSGVLLLLSLWPAMIIFAVTDFVGCRRRRDLRPGPLQRVAIGHGGIRWKAIAAAGAVTLAMLPTVVREARKEIDVFWLWFPIHVIANPHKNFDAALWRSPADLMARIKHLARLGHEAPGRIPMYSAWVFWVYNYQNAVFRRGPAKDDPDAQQRFKEEAHVAMLSSYRQALVADPDNPNYASYALMLNAPEWPEIFRRAIDKWPTYHHSPYMAYHMIAHARTADERQHFIGVYENGVGGLLASTASARPGYQATPRLQPPAASQIETSGVRRSIASGERVMFESIALSGAPKLRIGLFVQVLRGQVVVTAEAEGRTVPSCTRFVATPADALHYRYVDCPYLDGLSNVRLVMTGLDQSEVRVRDYYPLFSVVRSFVAAEDCC